MAEDAAALDETLTAARRFLLDARAPGGWWRGELSSSALSTATATVALSMANAGAHADEIRQGLDWLANNQNDDGGWGDTTLSDSNIATTLLCWCAFAVGAGVSPARPAEGGDGAHPQAVARAESWIKARAGSLRPRDIADELNRRYGRDRSFSAPILAACALSGRLNGSAGAGKARNAKMRKRVCPGCGALRTTHYALRTSSWRHVKPLPFELAVLPHSLWKHIRMPVVSYALPALIAVGQARHRHLRPRGLLVRAVRSFCERPTLKLLREIQPLSGGYLEAAPLTSFVVMCLCAIGERAGPVVREGVRFLLSSRRSDGSWPIDTNLATWVTTLSVAALSAEEQEAFPEGGRRAALDWLLRARHRREHPYTHAAAGGWAWTDLPGGVPDVDDTAGALLALRALGPDEPRVCRAAADGARWLLRVQNRDGGFPTFCRGWGFLPFDRSSPDLTAHALRAVLAWRRGLPARLRRSIRRAASRAMTYLARTQHADGAWAPLWFGCPGWRGLRSAAEQPRADMIARGCPSGKPRHPLPNLTYGTARVLAALTTPEAQDLLPHEATLAAGADFLLAAQGDDGGWGGAPGCQPSVEETALAVDAMCLCAGKPGAPHPAEIRESVRNGVAWLVDRTRCGRHFPPAPIGLYFARLWYFEKLYPVIFTVSALGRAKRFLGS